MLRLANARNEYLAQFLLIHTDLQSNAPTDF
jgi:hypothetical protein